jgi:hypothetical protein
MKREINRLILISIFLIFTLSSLIFADTIVLKDGKVLEGTFKGGSEEIIKFEVDGKVQEISLYDVKTVNFSLRQPPAPPPSAEGPVTLPAGTTLMVKLTDKVSTASYKKGTTFTAALDNAVVFNGQTVVPAGAKMYGTVIESRGGRVIGGSKIVIQFNQISVNGQLVQVAIDPIGGEAGKGGTMKMVGAGALVGAAFGGSSGAGKGAAIAGGAALLSARGNHIEIPAGTIAQVVLAQPAQIP